VARLFQVTRLLDPDPVRNRIRDTVAAGEPAALGRLAEEIDPAAQPVPDREPGGRLPVFSHGQGHKPTARYLQKAQPHHPGDFQINHNLAFS